MPDRDSHTIDTRIVSYASSGTGDTPIVSDMGTPAAAVSQWGHTAVPGFTGTINVPTLGATKFDAGKIDLSLVPLSALEAMSRGFMLGQKKYGRWNYLQGLEASRLFAAAGRHLWKWYWLRQELDDDPIAAEFGCTHLGNALCCIAMAIECLRQGVLRDDRPPLARDSK